MARAIVAMACTTWTSNIARATRGSSMGSGLGGDMSSPPFQSGMTGPLCGLHNPERIRYGFGFLVAFTSFGSGSVPP
jgi:hypothetical protein